MKLTVLLPFQIFVQKSGVSRIIAETVDGSFGILPRRRDCVAPLVPGILMYESKSEGEVYVAVDEGVLVKTGTHVFVSARRALGGTNLDKLHAAVKEEFRKLDEHEQNARAVMARLESGLLRRLVDFKHEQ